MLPQLLLACPHQGSAGSDLLPGLCFRCFPVGAFFPAWLPEAAPQALARPAWLHTASSKSAAMAQGLWYDISQPAHHSRKPPSQHFGSRKQAKQVWTSPAEAEGQNELIQTAEIRRSLYITLAKRRNFQNEALGQTLMACSSLQPIS